MYKVHADAETRSAIDLKKAGLYRYFEDETTSVLCWAYRIDDGPVKSWRPGDPDPEDLLAAIRAGAQFVAHNCAFDREAWNRLAPNHWPRVPIESSDCTMARALAIGLPAPLDGVGEALSAPVRKDRDGQRLMLSMCRPRGVNADGSLAWWDDPDRLERLSAYCEMDVASECAVDVLLPPLSERERRLWLLDQRINAAGFQVDLPVVQKALAVVDAAAKKADREMWALTNGAVKRCTETGKIVGWINAQGVPCSSVAKGEIDDLVLGAEVLDKPVVAQVVRLRRATARSSTAKYKAMLDSACRDGRIRGTLNYHRAHTGRWGGAGVQPQNFPRVDDPAAVEAALEFLRGDGSPIEIVDQIDFFVGPTMEVLSKCLRSMIVAAPGCELLGGDFTNIEGRINAWLNGETWKLEAFRAYDAGAGPDLYRVMAAAVNEKPVEEVTAVERQVSGKVPELACGYQGALGAFQKMAYTQNPPVRVADDLAKRIVALWREQNPNIVQGWWDLQDAAIEAVGAPGCVVEVLRGRVAYVMSHGFLFCRLPSSRVIAYPRPRLVWTERTLVDENGDEFTIERRSVEYMGVDSVTKRWGPQYLYGGAQMNHVVQGAARDRMVDAMFAVEDANLPIVLTVHDELLSEVEAGSATAEQYADLMMRQPAWAEGLPVAVKTWCDTRYTK